MDNKRSSGSDRASEPDLRHTLDSIQEGIQIIDTGWRYRYLNDAAVRHARRPREELIGRTMMEMYPGIEQTAMFSVLGECMEKREARTLENEFTYPDGTKGWFELSIQPVDGGILILSTDISERKRGEDRLRQQAELLDIVPDAIIVQDLEGIVQYWNKGAELIYGWTAEEALNRNVGTMLYSHDPESFASVRRRDLEEGKWKGELEQRRRDGRAVIVQSSRILLRDAGGKPRSVLVCNTDMTERKAVEKQYLRVQRMESIGTLAGGMAHDLNNVLGPILLSLDVLRRRVTDEEFLKIIRTIEVSAKRGADLVRQVLSFARGVEGERASVQVGHLVNEVRSIIAGTFPKHIGVAVDVQKDLPTVVADATQIHQVLMNLCVNARDAMPQGGTIRISAEEVILDEQYARMHIEAKPGTFVRLTITDDGSGIPPRVLERIFEPFFTTKDHDKGTGLGLATVQAIVKSHGGFINVYSEVGKGTTFRVYLPVREEQESPGSEEQAEGPMGHGETILIVDDEVGIREITKATLEAHGYAVLTAADGTEALAVYVEKKSVIALVVTDLMMPYMDGAATIRALRKMDPGVKIVAVSGLMVNGNKAEFAKEVIFLQKPYTSETLLNVVARALKAG